MKIAYITDKEMFLWEDGETIPIRSQYLKSYKENIRNIRDRKAWKQKSMTAAMGYGGELPDEFMDKEVDDYKITGLAPLGKAKSVIYSIRIEQMGGMFKVNPYSKEDREGHVFHDRGVNISNPTYNRKNKTLLYSIAQPAGQENLQTQHIKEGDTSTLTEGDSVDAYPSWIEDSTDSIVFQSAGIGRAANGMYAGVSPFGINRMDVKSGEIQELVQYDNADCLSPRMDNEGTLFYIKRPYKASHKKSNLLVDILMLPFRLINAIFQWLNFFTMRYSGKPLTSGSNPARNDGDAEKFFIHGNLIDAAKIAHEGPASDRKRLGLVPKNWQLVKLPREGKLEVLAEGIIAYDIASDGTVVCCNGKEIYTLDEKGKKNSLVKGRFIEKVYAW